MKVLLLDGDRRLAIQSGYGRLASALAEELPALGVEILFDHRQHREADVWLYVGPPYSMREGAGPPPVAGIPRVGFTMHEADYLQPGKEHWPDILNRADLVLTPTEWNRAIWRRLGVRTPIEVVPLGVDPRRYFPAAGQRCVFLTNHSGLGRAGSRENWRDTVRAYYAAFTPSDPVLLRIKTSNEVAADFDAACEAEASAVGLSRAGAPEIEVVVTEISHEELRSLYLHASMFIKNANREGWSIPCTEAVACEIPIAATAIEPLVSHLPDGTNWFELGDSAALAAILRRRFERFTVARRHTNQATGRLVSQCLHEHFGAPRPRTGE